MKRRMAGITGARAALVWLALASGVCADDAPGIGGLIARLADPSFAAREQASGEILARGRKQPQEIEKALADAYRHSADPEIRFRSKSILMTHFMESIGYLGVAYQRSDLFNPGGEKPPGVALSLIQEGFPAKLAGLLAGDVILAIDHKPLDPANPDLDFASRIQVLGAGRSAMLSVSRGGEKLEVKVTLVARPVPLTEREAEALFKARLREIEQKPGNR